MKTYSSVQFSHLKSRLMVLPLFFVLLDNFRPTNLVLIFSLVDWLTQWPILFSEILSLVSLVTACPVSALLKIFLTLTDRDFPLSDSLNLTFISSEWCHPLTPSPPSVLFVNGPRFKSARPITFINRCSNVLASISLKSLLKTTIIGSNPNFLIFLILLSLWDDLSEELAAFTWDNSLLFW